jgi:hypothetical protein
LAAARIVRAVLVHYHFRHVWRLELLTMFNFTLLFFFWPVVLLGYIWHETKLHFMAGQRLSRFLNDGTLWS